MDGANFSNGAYILQPTPLEQHVSAPMNNGQSAYVPRESIENVTVMDYSTDFPKLPEAPTAHVPKGAWARQPIIQSTLITESITLSANERASRGFNKTFGSTYDEQQKCNQIAQATGTKIELFEAKDMSLTVLITGKRNNVDSARARLIMELHTQASTEVDIPREHLGVIIGKEGTKLRALEHEYMCQIVMPSRNDKHGIIKIVGPNANILLAANKIREISAEMAKRGNESLNIPRTYYPWIRGPFNQNIDSFTLNYGVKINIPPSAAMNETITVTGEKSGVDKAVAQIRAIYDSKKDCKTLTCTIPRAQHRFISGTRRSGIDEILRDTDVIVELPADGTDSDEIILRGNPDKLGDALGLVYSKASSIITTEIKYSEWMRRYLIGPKGSKLQALVPDQDRLKVDFEDGGVIFIEGPPEAVKVAQSAMLNEISRLEKEMSSEIIKVAPNLHRHLIGRNGAQVNKWKDDFDVQISIPDEKLNSSEIRIEGKKDGVDKVKKIILEVVTRLENEKSRDIIIPHRFHGQIIGKKGESVEKWRKEYPSVVISFPDAMEKCDIVNLRGDKKEVDKLFTVLTKLTKELELSNYQDQVAIFKDYYKHIIGKNGVNINKIREETQTRIELPSGTDGRITVIGRQENVEKAIERINKIQNELANIMTIEVIVPLKLHSRLLASNRRLVRDIEDEFGGVHILFPKEKGTEKVVIRGPKEHVSNAEASLKELVQHCEQTTDEVSIPTKAEYIRFLIGREGSKVKKMRESYPSLRIIFPNEADTDPQIILIGKKGDVEAVKKIYQQQMKELNETIEDKVEVDPKWHRHFVVKSAEVLKEIQSQNGNCLISFPRQDSQSSVVTIKGSKSCVDSAKTRILEIVSDLEAQITINVSIAEEHHRFLLSHLNEIRSHHNVRIRVPDRGTSNENGPVVDGIMPSDLIQISGRLENCEAAKEELIKLIPISKSIVVPIDYHSSFIGKKGESVQRLMTSHAVRIRIPPASENNEEITITGIPANVEACLEEIRTLVDEYNKQAEDRRLRSFKITLEVPMKYHQRLIGPKGKNVLEIGNNYDVHIHVPRSQDNSETVTITGYEAKCNECADFIKNMIAEWESMIQVEVTLDIRFHPRIIGQKGRNLRKTEEKFDVEIRMPSRNGPKPDVIVVTGKTEDSVLDCIDELRRMEEDYISELIDRGQYSSRRNEAHSEVNKTPHQPKFMATRGAPWEPNNLEQFPAMGQQNGEGTPAAMTSVKWGVRP